ncbi:MAG: glycerophosphodiester phosphodiesterase [Kiritimatiellae bacterium]|nr:glycerophosphodiester phosphodiesterase [Kiritimatiellia bacterium]
MKIATLVLQTIAIAALAGCATVSKPGYDTLIAHRGESKDAPENTLPAYKLAVERGFGFECDLYLSKDGRVFTFHDSDLKRTTDGANSSKCSEVTWADTLSKLDVGSWGKWKDSKYAGTPPALLEDVLALAKNGRRIYLEIKAGPEIVPVIKAVLSSQKNANPGNILFICFNKSVCQALKDILPEYTVYWLVNATKVENGASRPITADEVVAGAREAAADGVDMYFNPEIVDEAFVAAVKKAGFSFHVWTVDDLSRALRAFAVGADTVTTNCAKELYDEYAALFAAEPEKSDEFSERTVDGAAFPTGF